MSTSCLWFASSTCTGNQIYRISIGLQFANIRYLIYIYMCDLLCRESVNFLACTRTSRRSTCTATNKQKNHQRKYLSMPPRSTSGIFIHCTNHTVQASWHCSLWPINKKHSEIKNGEIYLQNRQSRFMCKNISEYLCCFCSFHVHTQIHFSSVISSLLCTMEFGI